MGGVLLDLVAKPDKADPMRLVMTEEGIRIGTERAPEAFGWDEIDRVAYRAVDHHVNGSYMNTTFTIQVGSGKRTARFELYSSTTGFLKTKVDTEKRDANQEKWRQAVGILEDRVCARIATQAVATVLSGGSTSLGGVRLDPQGVHKDGVFKKTVAWSEVAGTRNGSPYFCVLARKGVKEKPKIQVNSGLWNQVLLGRVINAIASRITTTTTTTQ
jgi:hypothetical protein